MTSALFAAARAARTQAQADAKAQLETRLAEPATIAAAQASLKALDEFVTRHFDAKYFAKPQAQQHIAFRMGYDPATNEMWDPAVAAAVAGMINALKPEDGGGYAECVVYHRERLMGDPGLTATYLIVGETAEAAKAVPAVRDGDTLWDPWPFRDHRLPM